MTENEAKRKWCPFSRFEADNHSSAINRIWNGSTPPDTLCLASACMAWRWAVDPLLDFVADGKPIKHDTGTDGFCGLAGKP